MEQVRKQARRERLNSEDGRYELDLASINALDKTTRALNGLLKEIRALEKNAKEATGKLGATQRRELMLDAFAKLEEVHQYSLLLEFKKIYDDGRVSDFEGSPGQTH